MTRIDLSVVVLASAAVLLAGCGGGSSSPGVAHLSNTSRSSAGDGGGKSSSLESSGSTEQKMVAYSQCMRSHGVPEFPEPTEGHLLIHNSYHNGHTTGINPASAQFQAAQKVCGKLLPDGGAPSPAQQAKAQEGFRKLAQCMRSHGVPNFPEPTVSGNGGGGLRVKVGGAGGIDPNSPQFKTAQKACQSVAPGPKGVPVGGNFNSSGGPKGSGGESGAQAVAVP